MEDQEWKTKQAEDPCKAENPYKAENQLTSFYLAKTPIGPSMFIPRDYQGNVRENMLLRAKYGHWLYY